MKPLLNIFAILMVNLFPVLECSAQGKKVNFVKIIEYSPVNYEVSSDTNFYLSSINWEGDRDGQYFYKKIEFNLEGEPVSYHLSVNLNLGYIYLFWNDYQESFGIDYTLSDTIMGTFKTISFDFESDFLKSYSIQSESYDENETIHFYKLEDGLSAFYKNWLMGDAMDRDTIDVPAFFNFSKLPIEKIQRFYSNSTTHGDTILYTQYFIDSCFQNNRVSRDSLLIKQHKSLEIRKGKETTSYLAHILPESIEIETYTYDSVAQSTNQRMLKRFGNDTLYDIQLNTRFEGGQFISDYLIKGNHPVESTMYPYRKYRSYPNLKLDQLKQRKIHIARDTTGMIISGYAEGISSQGDTLKSVLRLFPISITDDYGFDIVEHKEPKIIEAKIGTQREQRDYDIVSLYPNLDLKPLSEHHLIDKDAVIGRAKFLYAQPQKSRKSKRRYKTSKGPSYKQYIWRKTKKIKSTQRKVKIRKEESYNGYTIYEFHYF